MLLKHKKTYTYTDTDTHKTEQNQNIHTKEQNLGRNEAAKILTLIMRCRSPASASSRTMFSSLFSMKDAKYLITFGWFSCCNTQHKTHQSYANKCSARCFSWMIPSAWSHLGGSVDATHDKKRIKLSNKRSAHCSSWMIPSAWSRLGSPVDATHDNSKW